MFQSPLSPDTLRSSEPDFIPFNTAIGTGGSLYWISTIFYSLLKCLVPNLLTNNQFVGDPKHSRVADEFQYWILTIDDLLFSSDLLTLPTNYYYHLKTIWKSNQKIFNRKYSIVNQRVPFKRVCLFQEKWFTESYLGHYLWFQSPLSGSVYFKESMAIAKRRCFHVSIPFKPRYATIIETRFHSL